MNKLYAVKLGKTRFEGRVVDAGHHTARTQHRVVNLILKEGIGRAGNDSP